MAAPLRKSTVTAADKAAARPLVADAGLAYDQSLQRDTDAHIKALRQRSHWLIEAALALDPDNADALNLQGRLLLDEGDLAAAARCLDAALALDPQSPHLIYSRAHVYLAAQDYDAAAGLFEQAENIAPQATRSASSLAYTWSRQGRFEAAFDIYRRLLKHDASDPHTRTKLFECARQLQATEYDQALADDICHYLDFTDCDPDDLAPLAASLIVCHHRLLDGDEAFDLATLATDTLLLRGLQRCQFHHPVLEEFLRELRRYLLFAVTGGVQPATGWQDLAAAVAVQAEKTEFVWSVTQGERSLVDELRALVSATIRAGCTDHPDLGALMLVLGMYQRLDDLSSGDQVLTAATPLLPKPLLESHILTPLEEAAAMHDIPRSTGVSDTVSRIIKAQYERYPYPRWNSLGFAERADYHDVLCRELPHLEPAARRSGPLKILIAGCGTGRHALRVGRYFRNVTVKAFDLSTRSLAYGERMARRYGIDNVEFFEADMLELTGWDQRFDIIECSGVLHHMAEPEAGLSILRSLLADGGLLKLALYSRRARRVITRLRELVGPEVDVDGIRAVRRAIIDADFQGDLATLRYSRDFYSLSGCRDLLFNSQEHVYDPVRIETLLTSADLEFLGFVNLPAFARQAYDHRFPGDPRRLDLHHWHEIEDIAPDIFAGMYQFYCRGHG